MHAHLDLYIKIEILSTPQKAFYKRSSQLWYCISMTVVAGVLQQGGGGEGGSVR